MGEWISVDKSLPPAVFGPEEQPCISEDVLVIFGDQSIDVANYDHEEEEWTMVNHGFNWSEIPPTHWQPLPDPPSAS